MFAELAEQAGLKSKLAYSIREVAEVSGIPYGTLLEDARKGKLTTFLPPGRKRGRLVRPEWFDAYWERGIHGM